MTAAPTISAVQPAGIGPGRLVLVVGPSGAGKDTLIGLVRAACAGDDNIVFPRRVVTREPSSFEENQYLNKEVFGQALARGDFAVHWEAHGHCYGLPRTLNDDIRTGRAVVANVSRTVVEHLRRGYADVVVISITAPPDILVARLAARDRGGDGEIDHRLRRAVDDTAADFTVVNVGSAEQHARRLLGIIKGG